MPRCSISLRVVTAPEDLFDGTANATFGAMDFRLDPDTSSATVTGGDDNVTENPSAGDGVMATVLMEVTYYHCASGSFWNLTQAAKADTHSSHGGCKLCTEEMDGTPEVMARTAAHGGCGMGGSMAREYGSFHTRDRMLRLCISPPFYEGFRNRIPPRRNDIE